MEHELYTVKWLNENYSLILKNCINQYTSVCIFLLEIF